MPDAKRSPSPKKIDRPPLFPPPRVPREADEGYGASHGNGPGHEGPSGPGDSPARKPATPAINDDPLEPEED